MRSHIYRVQSHGIAHDKMSVTPQIYCRIDVYTVSMRCDVFPLVYIYIFVTLAQDLKKLFCHINEYKITFYGIANGGRVVAEHYALTGIKPSVTFLVGKAAVNTHTSFVSLRYIKQEG